MLLSCVENGEILLLHLTYDSNSPAKWTGLFVLLSPEYWAYILISPRLKT